MSVPKYDLSNTAKGKNLIINEGMRVDQRDSATTPITSTSAEVYAVDRFAANCSANAGAAVITLKRDNTVSLTDEFEYAFKLQNTTAGGSAASERAYFVHHVEGFDAAQLAIGTTNVKTVTLSFWAQSSKTGTYCVGFTNSGVNKNYPVEYTLVAGVPKKVTVTLTLDTAGTWLKDTGKGLSIRWDLGSGSAYNATPDQWNTGTDWKTTNQFNWIGTSVNSTFYITGVQLEVGSVATPFEHRAYGEELALCQRYYERVGQVSNSLFFSRYAQGAANMFTTLFNSPKRNVSITVTKIGTFGGVNAGQPIVDNPGVSSCRYFWGASVLGDTQSFSLGGTSYIEIEDEL